MTILNLKVISDLDCNVYVDNELVATVKKDSLTIIPLSEGEFWVEFIPFFNSDCKVQTIVSLENHKVIQVSFRELLDSNPELHRDEDLLYDIVEKCFISNITGNIVSVNRDLVSKINVAIESEAYVFKYGRKLYPCNYDRFFFKNDKIIFGANIKWYLIKREEYEIIDIFDALSTCDSDNVIAVYKNGLCGFVKKEDGTQIIPCIYEDVCDHNNTDGYIAKKNDKWGLIDVMGEKITDFIYDNPDEDADGHWLGPDAYFYRFRYGMVSLKLNDKWGVIDNGGNEIVPFVYDFIFIDRNIIEVFIGNRDWKIGKWGLYNRNGTLLSPCIYDNIECDKVHNLTIVTKKDEQQPQNYYLKKYGVFNSDGEILPCTFGSIKVTNKGLIIAVTSEDGEFKKGLFNANGLEIIPIGKYGIILLDDDTLQVSGHYNGINTYGLYSENGEEILPCMYDYKTYNELKESLKKHP